MKDVIGVGDKVQRKDDDKHTAVVENIGFVNSARDGQVYCRWHKGYATWEEVHNLTKIDERIA